jgi:hypothetical protein
MCVKDKIYLKLSKLNKIYELKTKCNRYWARKH